MPSDDLTKWITSEVDFYTLLGITPESFSVSELRRAYRKTALLYHPDKLGDAFDPDKYEQFQAAHDVLAEPELKQKYDNYRNARVQKQKAAALFEGKRRSMKEDLEARERGGSLGKRSREDEEMDAEIKRLAEEGRKRRAKRQSMPLQRESTPPQKESIPKESDDDKIARLEQQIAAAKAKRKAEKKVKCSTPNKTFNDKKSGDFEYSTPQPKFRDSKSTSTPSTAPPKYSFSSVGSKKVGNDFSSTMEMLREAGKKGVEAPKSDIQSALDI